jgi:hypothetical protein
MPNFNRLRLTLNRDDQRQFGGIAPERCPSRATGVNQHSTAPSIKTRCRSQICVLTHNRQQLVAITNLPTDVPIDAERRHKVDIARDYVLAHAPDARVDAFT